MILISTSAVNAPGYSPERSVIQLSTKFIGHDLHCENKLAGMSRVVQIRALAVTDENEFVTAARRSRKLHAPWIAAPCDKPSFRRYVTRFDDKHHFGFIVLHAHTEALVGAINLTNVVYGAFRSGYLGYFAFAGHHRQGFMTQGMRQVVNYAFRNLGLHRVEANIQPGNVASLALVKSCGFRKEGFSPGYLKIGGRWRDHERWALVRGNAHAGEQSVAAVRER